MCRPEADDGTLLADVALGLVFGGLGGSHAVQHGQPDHGLRFQTHPVQEHGSLQFWLIVSLDGGQRRNFESTVSYDDDDDVALAGNRNPRYLLKSGGRRGRKSP